MSLTTKQEHVTTTCALCMISKRHKQRRFHSASPRPRPFCLVDLCLCFDKTALSPSLQVSTIARYRSYSTAALTYANDYCVRGTVIRSGLAGGCYIDATYVHASNISQTPALMIRVYDVSAPGQSSNHETLLCPRPRIKRWVSDVSLSCTSGLSR